MLAQTAASDLLLCRRAAGLRQRLLNFATNGLLKAPREEALLPLGPK